MKKNLIMSILIFSVFISFFLSGCNKNNTIEDEVSGVIKIDSVENIAFDLPLALTTKATAITEISDTQEYERNNIYSYKDGSTTYLLFCMNELIIMAQKGTSFAFADASDKGTCLKNSSLLNTWFDIPEKTFDYEEINKNNYYKIVGSVTAEVVITPELYGDYIGKLATIQSSEDEWSLFVGVVATSTNTMTKTQTGIINQIVNSMQLYSHPIAEDEVYDIVINQSLKETAGIQSEPNVQESVTNEITISDKKGLNISNQTYKILDSSKAYTSDEYSMLLPGQAGILTCIGLPPEEQVIIRINKVYTGEAAQRLINKYANAQGRPGEIIEAPDGYSWHLIEYDLSYENCSDTAYVNIKLRGLDGDNLIFKGISVEKRTYDAFQDSYFEGDMIYKNYCYYAIPNGCHSYSLECGDGTISNNYLSAYYHIEI